MVSARAFETRVTEKQSLQRLVYGDLKEMGLSAQPAIHVARKVADAYATLKANIRAGNLGEPGSKRRDRPSRSRSGSGRTPRSRSTTGACPGSSTRGRCRSGSVGRQAGIPFSCSAEQLTTTAARTAAASRICCYRDGKWYLIATCDIPDPTSPTRTGSSGSTSASSTSPPPTTATRHCGKRLNRHRHRSPHLRRKLQAKRHQVRQAAAERRRRKGSAVRRQHQPCHRQADRDRG